MFHQASCNWFILTCFGLNFQYFSSAHTEAIVFQSPNILPLVRRVFSLPFGQRLRFKLQWLLGFFSIQYLRIIWALVTVEDTRYQYCTLCKAIQYTDWCAAITLHDWESTRWVWHRPTRVYWSTAIRTTLPYYLHRAQHTTFTPLTVWVQRRRVRQKE